MNKKNKNNENKSIVSAPLSGDGQTALLTEDLYPEESLLYTVEFIHYVPQFIAENLITYGPYIPQETALVPSGAMYVLTHASPPRAKLIT